jgi:hypothetical protein
MFFCSPLCLIANAPPALKASVAKAMVPTRHFILRLLGVIIGSSTDGFRRASAGELDALAI